jgi:hypothetical protein
LKNIKHKEDNNMVNFYNLNLKYEVVTIVDIVGKNPIIISATDDGMEFEFSDYGFAKQDETELLNDDPHFNAFIKKHPEYLRSIIKTVFEDRVEADIV